MSVVDVFLNTKFYLYMYITLQVAVRNLWLGEDVDAAVRAKRFHHQLDPNLLVYEFGYPQVWFFFYYET